MLVYKRDWKNFIPNMGHGVYLLQRSGYRRLCVIFSLDNSLWFSTQNAQKANGWQIALKKSVQKLVRRLTVGTTTAQAAR